MTDYMPTTDEVRGSLVFLNKHFAEQHADVDVDLLVVESETAAQFDRWLAEVERAVAEKVLTHMANELSLMDDGGKRGLAGHSKSSASALTHRHAVAVVRARAEAYRQERKE